MQLDIKQESKALLHTCPSCPAFLSHKNKTYLSSGHHCPWAVAPCDDPQACSSTHVMLCKSSARQKWYNVKSGSGSLSSAADFSKPIDHVTWLWMVRTDRVFSLTQRFTHRERYAQALKMTAEFSYAIADIMSYICIWYNWVVVQLLFMRSTCHEARCYSLPIWAKQDNAMYESTILYNYNAPPEFS